MMKSGTDMNIGKTCDIRKDKAATRKLRKACQKLDREGNSSYLITSDES